MSWIKHHKVTIAMFILSVLIACMGIAFMFADFENNKQTMLALTPIWGFLPLAIIIERVAYKIKRNKEQK
jgi:hypothetical protein